MVPNLGYYVQSINDVVTETETIGEKMHPGYEKIRKAIDDNDLKSISADELSEIAKLFKEGTKSYQLLLNRISKLRAPAKVMGIHKKFEKAYINYVAGCEEMISSIEAADGVDQELFNASEQKQDEASDIIMFTIEKMSNSLLKK
ncbi:hypothetical protein M2139_002763 [Enterococcus sp. PF1-24]|uniref:hypothetical protein n=1 Tax=unclassified Enterococcus TaxID=2608891 RepID=UPI002474EAB5|nr:MULTISPECIES: hypothetical protein [unclassified Enterococcus]MDH6365743.1 hypothetical protein [Enterococcus sp. PFB1-1]MDH6402834.1 hypothetical protein [Enterococcus sp. PF1-24]